uniref:Nicomicin, ANTIMICROBIAL PROTEIN n=2 Tax=root TaxID=1 RepID=A0A8S5LR98_9CAUD|nr:MAG TPA: Nicomicin, ANTIMICROBIAL PROTEIN [Myoviridae sp. ctSGr1]
MGTIKRLNEARKAQKDAENAMPGAYQSQYKDRINETLDAMGGAGADSAVDTLLDKAYQQYRQLTGQNAAAAAQNAVDVTNGLSGGYGSDWAGNVAQQGYNEAMAAVDDAMPSLRAKALNQYQNQQNDLADRLSALMNQESMAQNQHNGRVADAENMRDYRQSRTNMAKQENTSFWNNVWNTVKNVGSAVLNAYDTYKGYTQQQWENEFAREQWEYNKNRTDRSDALNAYQQAFNLYTQDAGDAARDVLTRYGLNADAFANYTGAPITRDDQAKALTTAASLVANGNPEAAANLLKMYGMDAGAAGNYGTLTSRRLSTAAATKTGSSSGSGRRSSGRSGSSGTASGYTTSQLTSMANKFSSMKDTNPLYSHYKEVLTDAGWLEPETVSGTTGTLTAPPVVEPYTPASSKLRLSNTGNHTTQKATSGQTSNTSTGMPYSNALSYAKGWKAKGLNANEIATRLMNMGASDDVIDKAMLNAGF